MHVVRERETLDDLIRGESIPPRRCSDMARLRFTKMHGIGNDYVYVDCFAQPVADPARAGAARQPAPHRHRRRTALILICPSHGRRLPHGDVQRRRQPRRDVRQRHPLRRQVRLRARPGARKTRCASRPTPASRCCSCDVARRARRARHRRHGRADPRRPADSGRRRGPRDRRAARRRRHDVPRSPACRWAIRTAWSSCPRSRRSTSSRLGPRFEHHPFFPQRVNTEFVQVDRPRRSCACACGSAAPARPRPAAPAPAPRWSPRCSPAEPSGAPTLHLNGGDLDIEWRAATITSS